MPSPTPLTDPFCAELAGLNLVEASAGTGKTYTITGLYVRLIVERGLSVESILVVTFTNAATAELRDRIRSQLVKVRTAFEADASEDAFCQALLERSTDRAQALRRINHAVLGFDQAAIFTIHGFCQRVLSEHAFESGMPLHTELVTEQSELLQTIADDFWRLRVQDLPAGLADHLFDRQITPEVLLQAVRSGLSRPYLEVRAQAFPSDLEALEQAFHSSFGEARALWREQGEQIRVLLQEAVARKALKNYRPDWLEGWLLKLDAYLGSRPGEWPDKIEKFAATTLAEATKKGEASPRHAFFDACEGLIAAWSPLREAYAQAQVALTAELLEYCNRELRQRKRAERIQSYDDLLLNLDQALCDSRGDTLAAGIRRRYGAALIDEFQDTDPLQYEIFARIYRGSGLPVFLVGDPKQAIYSFRGADIYAYRKAHTDAQQQYTLGQNWRSDARLIHAVNTLFGQHAAGFFHDWIAFQPVEPAERKGPGLFESGASEAPLRVWFMAEEGGPISKEQATADSTAATAAEIARLLDLGQAGQARIGERALSGGDIAVLVRTHRQACLIRDRLRTLGINSVQQSREDVFHSPQAEELERVLLAVAEPGRRTRIMAALATDMLGLDGNAILELSADEQALEQQLDAFREHHHRWLEQGFMRMFRPLLSQAEVASRLLRFPDGERRLTNLLHLGELLHRHDSTARPSLQGLIKWLAQRRQGAYREDAQAELRLESDENLVQIVTIHKSKGLEYPIVFCPFLWDGRLAAKKDAIFGFHDPAQGFRPVLELGSEALEQARPWAVQEELAENLRLLYVALTRARHRCYLSWGRINEAGQSALAWLLHPPAPSAGADAVARMAEAFKALDDAALRARLEALSAAAQGAIRIETWPTGPGRPLRLVGQQHALVAARGFRRRLSPGLQITSFTALAPGHGVVEGADYDAQTEGAVLPSQPAIEQGPAGGIYAFPRGARAGRCLHAIFERLDFARCERLQLGRLVATALASYDFEPHWLPVISDMVQRVLATPLDEAGRLRLQGVALSQRLTELEFHYPVTPLRAPDLRVLLLQHRFAAEGPVRQAIEQLGFAEVRGFMKGYIDLVFESEGRFYIVDYKSNWLGDSAATYAREQLPRVIARQSYYLQYLLYALAVHRYLGRRLPGYDYERHFGGVYYLFLRGMGPETGPACGVYQDRPSLALMQALDACIGQGDAAA